MPHRTAQYASTDEPAVWRDRWTSGAARSKRPMRSSNGGSSGESVIGSTSAGSNSIFVSALTALMRSRNGDWLATAAGYETT